MTARTADLEYHEFVCPRCRSLAVTVPIPPQRTSDEFCPDEDCEFPMFWAPEVLAAEQAWERDRAAGASERAVAEPKPAPPSAGGVACPACGAPNGADAQFCSACGTSLTVAEPEPAESSSWPAWAALAFLVLLVAVVLAVVYWPF